MENSNYWNIQNAQLSLDADRTKMLEFTARAIYFLRSFSYGLTYSIPAIN